MADNSKKVSELPTAANVASTDRVLVLRDPTGNASVRTVNVSTLFSNISSSSNLTITSGSNTWTYSNNGTLTLPNGTKLYAGYPVQAPYDPITATLSANQVYLATTDGASYIGLENGLAVINVDGAVGSQAYWEFDNSKRTVIPGTIKAPQLTKASNANGTIGEICWDANYIYVCISLNTWKRAALTAY